MIVYKIFNPRTIISSIEKKILLDFLFEHLEQYGDSREDIEKAVEFALKEIPSFGGFVLTAKDNDELTGAVVVNRTGMKGYIPENILVYIATHKAHRGKGIGKELIKRALDIAEGDVALHVEPDNPAKFLYDKIGFTSKYIEMRYKNNK